MSKQNVFWNALKETPRLYVAPFVAAAKALVNAQVEVQAQMHRTITGVLRARTVDKAHEVRPRVRAKK